MRLQSMRLHPFGCFTDQSWDLAKPLVVIHGPNEVGKTTLRKAIFHALFTPTDLSKTQLDKTVRPWFRLPDCDHAQVTLTFEHKGTTWTLEKRWGAAEMSRLSDGTTAKVDSAAVQQRLAEMLVHSEATYRHVLFTGQAELERTFLTIREKEAAGELRDIGDLLQAAVDSSADVDESALRRKLAERIEDAFGRWDDANSRPERQGGRERGVADPWINGVGDILRAWYAWKTLLAARIVTSSRYRRNTMPARSSDRSKAVRNALTSTPEIGEPWGTPAGGAGRRGCGRAGDGLVPRGPGTAESRCEGLTQKCTGVYLPGEASPSPLR